MSLLRRHHALVQDDIFYHGSATSVADGGSSSDSPQVVTPPANMLAGDFVFVFCSARDNDNAPITVSATGGQTWFNPVAFTDAGGDGTAFNIFWCKFNGTWSTNPSFAFTTGTAGRPRTAVMHVFRATAKVYNDWDYESHTTPILLGGSMKTAVSRTTTAPVTLAIASYYAPNQSTWTFFSDNLWSDLGAAQYRNVAGLDTSQSFAYKVLRAPGTTDDVAKTMGTAVIGFAFQIVFKRILT